MLTHRVIGTAACGDTEDTESPRDTACVDGAGHYQDGQDGYACYPLSSFELVIRSP